MTLSASQAIVQCPTSNDNNRRLRQAGSHRPPFPAVFVIAVLGIARISPADLGTSLGGVIINFWTFLLTELIPDVVFVYMLALLLFLLCICRQFIDEFIAHARRLCLFLRLTPKLTDFCITSHDISLRSPLSSFTLRVCPDAVLKKGLIKTIAPLFTS